MNTINTYIGNKPPKNSNTIWLRPLKQGGVGFYVWVNNSAILTSVSWSWVFKPLFEKLGWNYKD